MYSSALIKKDTQKKLWNIKIEYNKRSFDEIIFEATTIYELILELSKKYNLDPVNLSKEMLIQYEKYLKERITI